MPPVYGFGAADTRNRSYVQCPPKITNLKQNGGVNDIAEGGWFFEHAGSIWVIGKDSGNWTLYNVSTTTDTAAASPTNLGAAASGQPYSIVKFDGIVYIGMGFSINVWRINAAGTVAQSGDSDVQWKYATVTTDRMYFNATDTAVRSVSTGADPWTTEANWSGETTVVSSGNSITGLTVQGRVLYVQATDGLITLDDQLNINNALPELKHYIANHNGQGTINYHGGLLYPHTRGLFFYLDGVITPIDPTVMPNNNTFLRGRFLSFVADGDQFWALVQAPLATGMSNTRYLLVNARERSQSFPGEGPFVWRVMDDTTTATAHTPPTNMIVGANGKLYFWRGGVAAYIQLPLRETNKPETPGSGSFATSGTLELPVVDMEAPLVDKYLKSMEVDLDNTDADQTVTLKYSTNVASPEPTFTALGAAITATGRTERNFPTGTTCRDVILKLDMAGTSTNSPVIRRVALNYLERPNRNKYIEAQVLLGDGFSDREGGETGREPDAVITLLDTYEASNTAQTLIDPLGRSIRVVVLECVIREEEDAEDPNGFVFVADLLLEEVPSA